MLQICLRNLKNIYLRGQKAAWVNTLQAGQSTSLSWPSYATAISYHLSLYSQVIRILLPSVNDTFLEETEHCECQGITGFESGWDNLVSSFGLARVTPLTVEACPSHATSSNIFFFNFFLSLLVFLPQHHSNE